MANDIQQFDFDVDLLQSILWQYNEAVNLQALLEMKQAWYDVNQRQFWLNWLNNVFDLRTCNSFGLVVWSIILGQPLFINRGPDNKLTFGFDPYQANFNRSNFNSNTGSSFILSEGTARTLLRLRYYQLTGSGTVPEINRILKDVFGHLGLAYVVDLLDMNQQYVFTFPLPSDLIFLFNNFDILPRPAGVGSDYNVIIYDSWGFGEFHENFENGNFSEL